MFAILIAAAQPHHPVSCCSVPLCLPFAVTRLAERDIRLLETEIWQPREATNRCDAF